MTVVLGPIIKKVAGIGGLAKFTTFSYCHSGRRRKTNGGVTAITAWTLRKGRWCNPSATAAWQGRGTKSGL